MKQSAEQSAIARADYGVTDNAMTGSWRVIIARTPERARTWYYNANDDPRLIAALGRNAAEWFASFSRESAQSA